MLESVGSSLTYHSPKQLSHIPFPPGVSVHSVLVVDDDEMHLALMQNILQKEGYKIFTTADGPQGIAIYKEHRPDIVLLDLGLPRMNGLEILRRLKTFDENAKIIVLTGYGSEESAELALRYGASDYIRKPFDFSSLIKRIKAAIYS